MSTTTSGEWQSWVPRLPPCHLFNPTMAILLLLINPPCLRIDMKRGTMTHRQLLQLGKPWSQSREPSLSDHNSALRHLTSNTDHISTNPSPQCLRQPSALTLSLSKDNESFNAELISSLSPKHNSLHTLQKGTQASSHMARYHNGVRMLVLKAKRATWPHKLPQTPRNMDKLRPRPRRRHSLYCGDPTNGRSLLHLPSLQTVIAKVTVSRSPHNTSQPA